MNKNKVYQERIATIVIASEASASQYDESKSFVSSDSLKPIAITSSKCHRGALLLML